MADERMVPLTKPGELVNLAMKPNDFFNEKTMQKDGGSPGELETAADAGYRLGDYYEDMTPYDGPKTKRTYERQQGEKRAERSAAAKADAPKADEPVKAETKKD